MSINAPYTCKKMFQTVSTKQTETRDHTQMSPTSEVEGESSMAGALGPTASGFQVFMILAALTLSVFVTKHS